VPESLVFAVDTSPELQSPIDDQQAGEDQPFTFSLPAGMFTDEDGDALAYTASRIDGTPLPSWLSFDTQTQSFSGTPLNGDVGNISIKVTATDDNGGSAEDVFDIAVTNANDPPAAMTTYYVDATSGSDSNDGLSAGGAFQTIAKLLSVLGDDCVVRLARGETWNEQLAIAQLHNVIVEAYGSGDKPTLTNAGGVGVNIVGATDVLISDLAVTGCGGPGVSIDSSSVTLWDNEITQNKAVALNVVADTEVASHVYSSGNFYGDKVAARHGLPGNGQTANFEYDIFHVATKKEALEFECSGSVRFSTFYKELSGSTAAVQFDLTVPGVIFTDNIVYAAQRAMWLKPPLDVFTLARNCIWDAANAGVTFEQGPPGASTSHGRDEVLTYAGPGSVIGDPLFADPANGDYSLRPGSAASGVAEGDANAGAWQSVGPIGDKTAIEDMAFSFVVPPGTFTDDDATHGDTLTYNATRADGGPLPGWLTFDALTLTFSGTPLNGDVGTIWVMATATDSAGASATHDFEIAIANSNDAPTVAIPITDQSATEDGAFSFSVPMGTFGDDDLLYGDALTYAAAVADGSPLPAWLTFDAATQTFSGTPRNADVTTLAVKLTASDGAGAVTDDIFSIVIGNKADAPVLVGAVPDQSTVKSTPFTFSVAPGTFTDDDLIHGDALTYAATLPDGGALPVWLTFDASTQTFVGTPGEGDVGTVSVMLVATDMNGASAHALFEIAVSAGNNEPEAAPDAWFISSTTAFVPSSLLLANDSDPDLDPLNLTAVGAAANGEVSLAAGVVGFTPTASSGSFDYVVEDAFGAEATGTVTVQVAATGIGNDRVSVPATPSMLSYVDGQSGNDKLTGSAGRDTLVGAAGDDSLLGAAGSDELRGGDGKDTLAGGVGPDLMDGGDGNDRFLVDDSADAVVDTGGVDLVESSAPAFNLAIHGPAVENLTLVGSGDIDADGNSLANTLTGNGGDNALSGQGAADRLFGANGDDVLLGGDGDDRLSGDDGDDRLEGGGANDLIIGGNGLDTMAGGAGADSFQFEGGEEGFAGVIVDFAHSEGDKVNLKPIDAIPGGIDDKFTFISAGAFTGVGQVRAFLAGDDTIVEANITGDFMPELKILLPGYSNALLAVDFIL
jgi:Ca2+-binding RTX toxin-like protein